LSVVSSPLPANRTSWAFLYAAIVLTTASTLITEIALTRIFSVVFQYHYAFLAISIALFGLSAGGVLSYLLVARGAVLYRRLGILSLLDAGAIAAALAVAVHAGAWPPHLLVYAAVYFAAAVPFIFSGMVLSLIISETIDRVERVYFFDLAGAAAGCLLVIPFLNVMGGAGAILGAAVLLAAASAVWFGLAGAWAGRALATAASLALVGLIVVNHSSRFLDIASAKGRNLRQETFVQWNSFSRVSLQQSPPAPPLILLDATPSSRIPDFDPLSLDDARRDQLLRRGPGYAYRLRPGGKTLVIGAGGGWDVALALAAGSKSVTAVEINPIIVNTLMRGRFRHLSRSLFLRPEVRVFVEDGRSFIRRTPERFDLIQATLVDPHATAAGAHALSENSIYTVEAFLDYLGRLNPGGLLSFTHWGLDPPRESLRLAVLARDALLRDGAAEPSRHIIVLREQADALSAGATDTVLISRRPFPVEELERAALEAARASLEIIYMPGQAPDSPFASLLLSQDASRFLDSYPYDVRPVTDDRPFFFFTSRLDRLFSPAATDDSTALHLFALAAVSLAATLVTLALPPLLLRARLRAAPGVRRFLLYFLCLGAGYVVVQVGLIQRLVMLLGHPTYALTVVIFSMLVWSSLGSFFSRRFVAGDDRRLLLALAAAAALISATAFLLAPFARAGAGWELPWKLLASMALLAPAAFVMGMAFPAGLMRLDRWHRQAIQWAWSINAAASVLGSCSAVLLAVSLGLRNTLLCGALLYLGAFAAVLATRRFVPASR
jgi:SAM-dependent methyltransferase